MHEKSIASRLLSNCFFSLANIIWRNSPAGKSQCYRMTGIIKNSSEYVACIVYKTQLLHLVITGSFITFPDYGFASFGINGSSVCIHVTNSAGGLQAAGCEVFFVFDCVDSILR